MVGKLLPHTRSRHNRQTSQHIWLYLLDLTSYGELVESKFINVGCVVLENIDLYDSYLIH